MGKYQPYSEYKDSGLIGLDKIPAQWKLQRVKFLFDIGRGRVISQEELVDDGLYPVYSSQTMNNGCLGYISSYDFDCNQITWTTDGANAGTVFLRSGKHNCTNVCGTLQPKQENENLKFYLYCLEYVTQFHKRPDTNGAKIMNGEMAEIFVTQPCDIEKEKIANFLDHETAKIDTLIEKQQQLIQLLKEKRQAVISHAVTKGLNPNAKMRDSGVEWLGIVPEHWDVSPLKYLCTFSGGGTPTKDNLSYWTDGNIPWVSPKDMKTFWLSDTQDKVTERAVVESSTNFVESGALLMVVRSGILQRSIPIAINTVRVTLNQDMKALRFNERVNVEYAANFIIGCESSLLLEWSKEGATVESIEHEYLSSGLFPVPPIDEQTEINTTIKERMKIFQGLEDHAARGITFLQERRTALISAAVTGKIDVRNWQAPPDSRLRGNDEGRGNDGRGENNANKEVAA
jgi:type I restriction enzyme S subunit